MSFRSVVFILVLFACSLSTAQAQNQSIIGNLCVGLDCESSELFGLDVLKVKDINIRVSFDDESRADGGFPTNDWRITVNSALNGGPDFFAIDDSTNELRAFMIEDRSQDNALVISDQGGSGANGGYIGIGTEDPLMEVHIFHGDSPGIRLEQDGTEGFGSYVWDVAGNDRNFFIRDQTTSEALPFRVFSGARTNGLTLADSSVGIGTDAPSTTLHLQAEDPGIRVENTTTGADALHLDANGNLTLSGVLTEASSALVKENRQDVNVESVLRSLRAIPVQTWNYVWDAEGIRHMGPMAQDVFAAFGLGVDEAHLAPLDANGIAMAAIQALTDRTESQARENDALRSDVEALKTQNADLEARVERLETALQQLLNAKSEE